MGGGKRAKARRRSIMAKAQLNGHGLPRCTYCGVQMSRKAEHYAAPPGAAVQFFTMDHIIPRAKGGCNDQRNLTGACRPCNEARGDMPLDEFIESLGDRAVITVDQAREMMALAHQITLSRRFGFNP
jgi:5-methylcytosine-specific restriction endonuclease McrA